MPEKIFILDDSFRTKMNWIASMSCNIIAKKVVDMICVISRVNFYPFFGNMVKKFIYLP